MCIAHSVGKNGVNKLVDAKMVQALLNENLGRLIPFSPLVVDGHPGELTLEMIGAFQRRVLGVTNPSYRVNPDSQTLQGLRDGMSAGLTIDKLRAIMTYATHAAALRYLTPLVRMMVANQIDTPLRMAHFLAQLGHESGDLRYGEEIASGEAYEGRLDLGNTEPGDGARFKGRGLIQLTGRSNYTAFGAARHRDFVTEPNNLLIASDATLAVDVSCWYWTTHGLNSLADADNLNGITQKINGGLNGLPDRAAHLQRAKCLLVP